MGAERGPMWHDMQRKKTSSRLAMNIYLDSSAEMVSLYSHTEEKRKEKKQIKTQKPKVTT